MVTFRGAGRSVFGAIGCATPPERSGSDSGRNKNGSWAGVPIGAPPTPNSRVKQAILSRAHREWEFFGRQTVVLKVAKKAFRTLARGKMTATATATA
ncbi:hypothetical protein [Chromatium okenii]|uniref:hypothetical protein n=1 Tax=Chromatium okenii TaxID=61644 RepID=UPI001F5BEC1F|nr:hypothetical protein [Chromatium okenii]